MGGRVMQALAEVVTHRQDLLTSDHSRSDRDFSLGSGHSSLIEGHLHEAVVPIRALRVHKKLLVKEPGLGSGAPSPPKVRCRPLRVNGPSPATPAPGLRVRVARALRHHVRAATEGALLDHAAASHALREALPPLRSELTALGQGVQSLRRWLELRRAPFVGEMTVHEAWARHRGVRAVFARYHLPACDACAVGVDETLAEAAFGHRIDPEQLLRELNELRKG